MPVDISRDTCARPRRRHDVRDAALMARLYDVTLALPPLAGPMGKRVGFFPGSTIGNFEPDAVVRFLDHCAQLLGPQGEMLIGVDLKKAPAILNSAYNDRAGLNAAFNLNLLERVNRELDGDLDVAGFEHLAFYKRGRRPDGTLSESLAEQTATIAGTRFRFAEGELIHTENSYKYAIPEFRALACAPASPRSTPGSTRTRCSACTTSARVIQPESGRQRSASRRKPDLLVPCRSSC
jgi:uncharacterized SAM-dependent methyltransferase